MEIQTTAAGGGPRRIFDRDIMAGHYPSPGLTFEADADHDHPVAECRKDVGEALIERYPGIEAVEDTSSASEDADDASDAEAADAATTPTDGDGRATGAFDLESLPHVGPATAKKLNTTGYGTAEALGNADAAAVAGAVPGLSAVGVEEMQTALREQEDNQ